MYNQNALRRIWYWYGLFFVVFVLLFRWLLCVAEWKNMTLPIIHVCGSNLQPNKQIITFINIVYCYYYYPESDLEAFSNGRPHKLWIVLNLSCIHWILINFCSMELSLEFLLIGTFSLIGTFVEWNFRWVKVLLGGS